MRRSSDIGTGAYASGRPYLSVWTLVAGQPDCVVAPVCLHDVAMPQAAAIIATNRAIGAICARAEAVEAADRLAAMAMPTDAALLPSWLAACDLLADVAGDTDLQHLLRTRAGELAPGDWAGPAEAPWHLSLPPVPDLDPVAQTADWDGAAWVVRALTGAELAFWPLRPPPVPATVTRTQLRLELSARGKLVEVDTMVTASGDAEMVERWGAATMERASPLLIAMAGLLWGWGPADIDDVFRAAAGR